jgi:spore maturation protein CgeB
LNSYKRTVSVLDIELNIQSGLTMRTFEALGAGVKLITTNTKIIDEPFYDKNVAMVIDRINPDIDINFFNNNLTVDKNFRKYSFDNWLNNIFTKIN